MEFLPATSGLIPAAEISERFHSFTGCWVFEELSWKSSKEKTTVNSHSLKFSPNTSRILNLGFTEHLTKS